ncbi:putative ATP-dependent endonuclease of OLD family [Nitrosospira sp. Nsp2]|uniref:AAA family ATPase n=1 Tax=Nitrosospira sp. Nsp2 TaxID=136548 RepID=UPI000D31F958|nr:AAA family ATPase [Nitrosospira sp. Nsp2]PTR14208.1 putative ATP-dependent endonuclease of OLD family [Nitrosospira sp. Nsp2]
MNNKNVLIKGFALGGYRSFGDNIQRFEDFSKINLFVGQNNCGKSNVLRFLYDIYPKLAQGSIGLDKLDLHVPSHAAFRTGTAVSFPDDSGSHWSDFDKEILPIIRKPQPKLQEFVLRVFREKAKLDDTKKVWFDFNPDRSLIQQNWEEAFRVLSDSEMEMLWSSLTAKSGGMRQRDWYPDCLRSLTPKFKAFSVAMVPAIRRVGTKGSLSEEFSGDGIIERLVKLQNPGVHNRTDNEKFQKIVRFLQTVTDNETALIEIPHEKDTILVIMDGKALPLESLGTGIHEVIILAAAATILENTVVCMEEPELHLNPVLQKKLIRHLLNSTNNQYFISTHSASFMDTPQAEIYHIQLLGGKSMVERATTDKTRSAICEDLGYHPSDLLQSNCVIWVEGPSDRIYLNWWISSITKRLIEGIHYSIMFYGGRLASHLSGEDVKDINGFLDDFISLRRLNRRGVVLIDSDREKKRSPINSTKMRLREEFDKGPGFAWITEGREIENYLDSTHIEEAIRTAQPSLTCISSFTVYENYLSVLDSKGKTGTASKVKVAKHISENCQPDLSRLDLKKQIKKLVDFIDESNVGVHG